MKRLFIISILLLNLVFVFGQKTMKEYLDKENVTTVTISKNMLSLFPKNADISYGGVNVAEFLNKLSYINIFASLKADAANDLINDATQFMGTSGYDKLISVKTERNENVNFYIQANEENISDLILIVQSKLKESAVVQLTGKFTMKDIQQMIASAKK